VLTEDVTIAGPLEATVHVSAAERVQFVMAETGAQGHVAARVTSSMVRSRGSSRLRAIGRRGDEHE
jgi:hypothetical protein